MKRAFIISMLALLTGCQSFLAERLVAPPNGGLSESQRITRHLDENELQIPVGPPDATLCAWVLEPAGPARGTILALHGFLNSHSQFADAGKTLRDEGYRVVLVDLRGHGSSTGDHITYGVDDSRDLIKVVDFLQRKNLCGATLGLLGASYGAATAIQYAAADPRVTTVVAIAPFASLREEAPYFGKHILPLPAAFYSPADFTTVVDTMGKLASFDPDACNPLTDIKKTQAHIRLFHGELDMIVPPEASRELNAAAPDRTQLTLFPAKGHLDLCFDVFGELRPAEKEWFDRYLALPPK